MLFDWYHLKGRKTNYLEHLWFAARMSLRILLTGIVLTVHSIIPWIRVPKYFHIVNLSNYLYDCDYKIRIGKLQ